MTDTKKPLGITDVILRDAHQSLLATRMRLDDMLPIAEKLDKVGFWSLESWGGATFDSCIRYLGEDPWERIRELKKAMPNTQQQMLLRGQNLLGYRHYADDVVDRFCERAAENGVVIYAGDGLKEFGNTVLVRHENGLVTVYGHASEINVQRGQKVRRGEEIAKAGMSGSADTPKLHFEVRKDSAPVDPSGYLE